MNLSRKRKLAVGAGAALAAAGGGAAIAATQLDSSPAQESQAIVDDAAKRLGIQPGALSDALKQALVDRIDAAVAAGRLTKSEGDALKQRIESGDFPLFFGAFPGRHLGDLGAAASYLGVTAAELRSDLEAGKTLAEVAKESGQSVDGLVQAMTEAAKQRLDAAVAAGRLTKAKEDSILADLQQRIARFVNGQVPGFRGFRFGHGFRHAPGDDDGSL